MVLYYILLVFGCIGIDLYGTQSIKVLTRSSDWRVRNFLYSLFWGSGIVLLFGLLLTKSPIGIIFSPSRAADIEVFFYLLYITKLFLAATLLFDDLRRGAIWLHKKITHEPAFLPSRSRFLSKTGVALGLAPLATLGYGILRNRYRFQLRQVEVPILNLPVALQGLRLVQISDIHAGTFKDETPLKEAIQLINAQNADFVFFTGDLVNARADEMAPFIDIFKGITAKQGVFSILGNHDYGDYEHWATKKEKCDNFDALIDVHKQLGWQLLRNENRIFDYADARLGIIGVENYSVSDEFPTFGDLSKAYQGTEATDCKILLSHDPSHWDAEVRSLTPDVALTLSGHTHGFQFGIEIPGFLQWSPCQFLYKQWAGLYQQQAQMLYVNRGLGMTEDYPGRIGILPEITVLELVNKVA